MPYMRDIKMAKVVGENEDGLTLFVAKDEQGTFHLTEGDQFLSILFCRRTDRPGEIEFWTPWEEESHD